MLGNLKFSSGIYSLDLVLQGILKGDNVVWQTDNLLDYISFAGPFARKCLSEGKQLVYFRFAAHPPVLSEDSGADFFTVDPKLGFEQFINAIFAKIESKGRGACYVFDCLSDLAVDWYSDRMLANFFMLACPYLYRLDTVAYFMLLKNINTREATDAIHDTAQVVIDVFRSDDKSYILPVKVENRYTPTLYMPHLCDNNEFKPVMNSPKISEILSKIPGKWGNLADSREDVWTKTFKKAKLVQENDVWDKVKDEKYLGTKKHLARMIMTRDKSLEDLCEKLMDVGDLVAIGRRMIGTGLVGGKSVGMLIAKKILSRSRSDYWNRRLEQHDSFFLGSDVFYTYLVENDCWWHRRRIVENENIGEAAELREKLLSGS
nr:hypothetical protein [Victivallales bacterium]